MPFTRSLQTSAAPAFIPVEAILSANAPAVESAAEIAAEIVATANLARRAQRLAGLVALNTPAAASALAGLIAHPDAAVRASGVDGLRRIAPEVARPALAAMLASPSSDLCIRALDAIDRVPDPEIEAWLIGMLNGPIEGKVCAVVLDLLAEMGTAAALPAIRAVRLRFANEPFVAFAADHALAQIGQG